jgi:uncharacterized protein
MRAMKAPHTAVRGGGFLAGAANAGPATVPHTRQIDYTSSITGRRYRLQIAMPVEPAPASGYPVLFVLDGDMYFSIFANFARFLSTALAGGKLLPAVVVGVGYPETEEDMLAWLGRRNFDMTPTDATTLEQSLSRQLGGIKIESLGGAAAFLSAIEIEMVALVAGEAPLDLQRKVLFGHSLGGLFTLYAAFTRPDLFATYLALSPSIWWDGKTVLSHEKSFVDAITTARAAPRLFLGVGGLEQSPELVPDFPAEEIRGFAMIDNMVALAARLFQVKAPGFEVCSKVYDGQTHVSVGLAALNDMLEFALSRHGVQAIRCSARPPE